MSDEVNKVEAPKTAPEVKAETVPEAKPVEAAPATPSPSSSIFSLLILNSNPLPVLHLCLESFHQMAADPNNVEYVVATKGDLGDLDRSNLKVVRLEDPVGSTEALNEAAQASKGNMLWVLTDNYLCVTKNWDKLLGEAFTAHGDSIFYAMVDDNLHSKLKCMSTAGCTTPVLGRGGYEKQTEVYPKEVMGGGADTAEFKLYLEKAPHCVVDLSDKVSLVYIDRAKWVSPLGKSELSPEEVAAKTL